MSPPSEDVLIELRIAMAEVRAELKHVNVKLDQAMVSREHLETRLAPILKSLDQGRGALAVVTLLAGAIGATVATFIKQMFHVGT
jgi:hypothetical protein